MTLLAESHCSLVIRAFEQCADRFPTGGTRTFSLSQACDKRESNIFLKIFALEFSL